MSASSTILVLGATGMLGQALMAEGRRRDASMLGLARSGTDLTADIRDDKLMARILADVHPRVVINCAAVSSINACELDPGGTYLINARAVGILAELTKKYDSYLVQISTDHYFSGDRSSQHDEMHPVRFLNEYALTKFAGERFALACPGALVIRTNVVGFRGLPGRPTFVEWMIESLNSHNRMDVYDDFFTSSIDVKQFSVALFDLLPGRTAGVLNLAAAEVASKKQFIEAFAQAGKFDTSCFNICSVRTLEGAPRAESVGLDVSKAEGLLGRKLPRLDAVIQSLVNEYRARQ
jgi:dTDP-4-dehydrorhamnose reductase